MAPDKYSAIWVSHTSINDFLQCKRAYFLKHVYKSEKTGRKMKLMTPPLALGQAVHEVIEEISKLHVHDRFKEIPMNRFEKIWKKVSGKKGGFLDIDTEDKYKREGREMIARVTKNPGPISRKAVKIKESLPNYWLSEEENIILCGKVDWLEYLEDKNGVNIIDFKTGSANESKDSLQLPIYLLLVANTQKWDVMGASYWYIRNSNDPVKQKLPDMQTAYEKVLSVAKEIKAIRSLGKFDCEFGGCRYCTPMERLYRGEGEFVYVDEYRTDVFVLPIKKNEDAGESEIL